MMRATFRSLPVWPYAERPQRHATYRVGYDRTIEDLEREIELLGGTDVVIGIGLSPSDIRLDGLPRAGAKAPGHDGVEVSFSVGGRRQTYHTDTHRGYGDAWKDNLRAVALGLEALRAVDRYGITSGGEQYAGFAQIEAGETLEQRGERLVQEAGSLSAAMHRHHPDKGGNEDDMRAVLAYRAALQPVAV